MYSSKSRERLTAVAIIAIVILLAINAILLYTKYNQDKLISKQKEEINEARRLQSEAEKEYYEAVSELEEMRGDNEQLNAMIDQQKAELQSQRERIDRLIRVSNDLQAARAELAKMKDQVDEYIAQIDRLEAENVVLHDANRRLEEERQLLTQAITQERQTKDELKDEKAELITQTSELQKEREKLTTKVTRASAIKAENIVVEGYKTGSNGKLRNRSKARNIELLEVCFDLTENAIAPKGKETFYLRIIDPLGETLALESLGSGVLTHEASGEAVRYTRTAEIDYNADRKRACIRWQPNLPFKEGMYKLELYNKGYLTGVTEFELK